MATLNARINILGNDKASGALAKVRDEAKKLKEAMTDSEASISKNNLALQNIEAFKKSTAKLLETRSAISANIATFKQHREQLKKNTSAIDEFYGKQKLGVISAKEARTEIKKLNTANKQLNKSLNSLNTDTKTLKNNLSVLHTQQKTLKEGFKEAGIEVKDFAHAEKRLNQEIASSNTKLKEQQANLDKLNKRREAFNALKDSKANAYANMAKGAIGLYAGMQGVRKTMNFIAPGIDMDKSMSDLAAVLREDKNSQAMVELAKQAIHLSQTTKFTGNEVAQAQFFLGRTGYSAEQVKNAMPGMLAMAAAGDLDVATTADIASNIQTAMRIPAEDMQHVADVMTGMFTRANVDIQMLGESLKYSAGIGASFGQSLETVVAATAMMGNAGIQGSQAGTTLRQILVRLGDSKAVKELGVRTTDDKGNMRDLIDIMSEISEATKKMGNVQRGTLNKKIAGQIGITGFDVLLSRSKELKELRGEQGKYAGESTKVASVRMDNVAGDLNLLAAAFSAVQVSIFGHNKGMLRGLIQSLTSALNITNEFLKRNAWLGKSLVMLAGGLSLIVAGFGAWKIALGAITLALLPLKMLAIFNPIAAIIVAVGAALTAIGFLIYQNWDAFSAYFIKIGNNISAKFSGMWQDVSLAWAKLTELGKNFLVYLRDVFKPIGNFILQAFSIPIETIRIALTGLMQIAKSLHAMATRPDKEFKSFTSTTKDDLKNMWNYTFNKQGIGAATQKPAISKGLSGAVKTNKTKNINSAPVINITMNGSTANNNNDYLANLISGKVATVLAQPRFNASLRDID